MRSQPHNLSLDALVAVLKAHWRIEAGAIEYLPLGFGSYHWLVSGPDGSRWFVTADAVGTRDGPDDPFPQLLAAYQTAAALRSAGQEFVVAPTADEAGQLVRRIDAQWAVAVFPFIAGSAAGAGPWSKEPVAIRAAGLVGRLHAARPPAALRPFSFALRHREHLFDRISEPWVSGPYGELARTRLSSARPRVEALLAEYDRLAAEVALDPRPWVVTHGEPHSANFINASDGRLHWIDWDTVRLAPPERDLAALPIEDGDVRSAYLAAAGTRPPSSPALKLFRMWWDASEICGYTHRFREPHGDSADDQVSWQDLDSYLCIDENWPDLASKP